jgi:hypothetical protein
MKQRTHLFQHSGQVFRIKCDLVSVRSGAPSDFITTLWVTIQGASGQLVGTGRGFLIEVRSANDCGERLSSVFQSERDLASYYEIFFDGKRDRYKQEFSKKLEDLLVIHRFELVPELRTPEFLQKILRHFLSMLYGRFGFAVARPARALSGGPAFLDPAWSQMGFKPTGRVGYWWADFSWPRNSELSSSQTKKGLSL